MDGAALDSPGWDKMKSVWIKRAELITPVLNIGERLPNPEDKKKLMMRVGLWTFKMAHRGDSKSTLTFLYPSYMARFHAKLGSDSDVLSS
jgi:hypothetical protein